MSEEPIKKPTEILCSDMVRSNAQAVKDYRENGGWLWAYRFTANSGTYGIMTFHQGDVGDMEAWSGGVLLLDGASDLQELRDPLIAKEFVEALLALAPQDADGKPYDLPAVMMLGSVGKAYYTPMEDN